MRHPVRILVIGLLLVLVIASRFLYSSVPENQHIQEVNLVAGNLALQHRLKNIDKKVQNSANTLQGKHPISSLNNAEKSALAMADSNGSQPKKQENDLSQVSLEKFDENKISLKEANDENFENDLNRRKIPDNDRLHKSAGQLSPFESETNDEEVAKRTAFLEEKALVSDQNKSGKVSKQNGKEAEDSLAANKDRGKKSEKKDLKSDSSQQENNILMILAKVGQTSPLAKRFKRCVLSMCEHSSVKLTFHIITDTLGKLTCEDTFNQAGKVCKSGLNVTYYDVDKVSKKIEPITKETQVCD